MYETMSTNKMPASRDSTIQSSEMRGSPKTAEGADTSQTTFFDLPAEIRDEIYDLVALSQPHECLFTWALTSMSDEKPDPVAQVNKQVRREWLSRYHRVRALSLTVRNGMDDRDSARTRKWMEIFAESRVPLTKYFRFWSGLVDIELRLRGGIRVMGSSDRFLVLQPDYGEDSDGEDTEDDWFALRGSEKELSKLVGRVLHEVDGSVYLTADGLLRIIEYLEGCRKEDEGQS